MKTFLLATALALVAIATGFSLHAVQPPSDTVSLPIEVIGPDGHTVTVQVNASTVSDVQDLYVQAHSIGYPYHIAEGRGFRVNKASIRLNGGAWYDVNTESVNCLSPESTIRCIEGPAHTVRFRIPISRLGSLRAGANTVSFRFNYASPRGELPAASTGYRVLDLQLQTSGGTNRIDGTSFVWDDPGAWTAPDGYGAASDIRKGEEYWTRRNLLVDGWGGPDIIASCADCHVQSGYDLQYFAYSNASIVQRSRFHGLSETQGKQIAAYIRSLDVTTEDGRTIDPPGRPWNPPYQPGLTSAASRPDGAPREQGKPIDDLDPVYWAAGAGIEWALDSDREMKPFLFPNGIAPADMQRDLNTREIPVALQMPDWNEWLPVVHPMDVWGSEFTSSKAWNRYTKDMQDARDANDLQDVIWATTGLWKEVQNDWRRRNGPGTYGSNPDKGVAGLGVFQWALTKTFELMQPNHFENDAQGFYGPGAEPLQWPGNSRIIFDQAPHILGVVKGSRSGVMDLYHDTAWYQHAMTLNPGSAIGTGLKPLDWKYHFAHLSAVQQYGAHSFRYLYAYAKLLQVAETIPEGNSSHEPKGYYMRHLTPGVIDLTHFWAQFIDRSLSDDEYRRAANVLLMALGDGLSDEPFQNWKRKSGNRGLDGEDAWPQLLGDYDQNSYHSHFWTALHNFGEAGVAYEVLKPLAEWAQVAWPRRDWIAHIEPYKSNPAVDGGTTVDVVDPPDGDPSDEDPPTENSADAPSVSVRTASGTTEYIAPSSIDLIADASDSNGRIDNVKFYVDGEFLKQENYDPYEATMTDPVPGTYTLTAVATDNDGAATTSAPVTITVTEAVGTVSVDPGLNYAYYEASSFKSIRDLDGMTPTATGQTANFDIGIAQRDDKFGFEFTGYIDIPSDDTYTFATTSDDGSGLWIGDQQVVSNDGLHGPRKRSGQIALTKGYHRITVKYVESELGQKLDVFWSSASVAEAQIPDARLFPERPSSLQAGTHQQRSSASSASASRIDLDAFAVALDGDHAVLSWQAPSDPGITGFSVQRKGPSGTWRRVGRVAAGVAPPSERQSYRFEDTALPYQAASLVYRLRYVDLDGTQTFSDEVTLSRNAVTQVQLLSMFPNPSQTRVTLRFALPQRVKPGTASLQLYDPLGRRVREIPIPSRAGRHETQVDVSGLASGVYFLRLVANGEVRTRRLTVAR